MALQRDRWIERLLACGVRRNSLYAFLVDSPIFTLVAVVGEAVLFTHIMPVAEHSERFPSTVRVEFEVVRVGSLLTDELVSLQREFHLGDILDTKLVSHIAPLGIASPGWFATSHEEVLHDFETRKRAGAAPTHVFRVALSVEQLAVLFVLLERETLMLTSRTGTGTPCSPFFDLVILRLFASTSYHLCPDIACFWTDVVLSRVADTLQVFLPATPQHEVVMAE